MTEIANLAPVQETFPLNGQKRSVVDSSKSMLKSAEKAYDNWEYVYPVPSTFTNSSTIYSWEFPSNRKFISNYRLECRVKHANNTTAATRVSVWPYAWIKSVRWYVGTTLIGSPYSGRALFLYLMHNLSEPQRARQIFLAGGPSESMATANEIIEARVPIVGPGNQVPFLNDNCESFPMHLLNDKNKKLRVEIEVFDMSTPFTTNNAEITIQSLNMYYSYTASLDAPIKGPKRLIYYELKDFAASSSLVSGTGVQFKLDQMKAPSEFSLMIFNIISDANNTAKEFFQGVGIKGATNEGAKVEIWANSDRLTYWNSDIDFKDRYHDRKGTFPAYALTKGSTTEYDFYAFSPAKHSSYTDLYSFITPGITINELQNFFMNVDLTSTATYHIEVVAVYKHELEITTDGEAILYSNK